MENHQEKPMPLASEPKAAQAARPGVGLMIGISLLVGAVSGGAVGALVAQGGVFGWLTANKTAGGSTVSTSTVTVKENSSTIDVVSSASPAVVSIVAKKDFSKVYGDSGNSLNDFFGFPFFRQQLPEGEQSVGSGSGFIISSDGMILTNKHVAEIEGDTFVVVMNDGKTYDARVVATDPATDIAFMKIDGQDLPTLELGDSDAIQVGQTAIAIGNVLGKYQNTVTQGIISGLSRSIQAGDGSGNVETLSNVIQTDAAINHGNSGGPLLNIGGQVIGINTAVDAEGQLLGFAIPINIAKRDLESLQKTGKIERPYLGVRYTIVNDQVKEDNQLTVDYGALLVRGSSGSQPAIIPGSPANKAGLLENDIILELNGKRITEQYDLSQALLNTSVSETVRLKVLSQGEEKSVEVKLEANPG